MNENVDFAKFVKNAMVTESPVPAVQVSPQFFTDVLEVAVASAMLLDQVKKHIFYRDPDPENPAVLVPRPLDPVKSRQYLDQLSGVVQRLQQSGLAHEIANPTTQVLPVNVRLVHAFIGKFTESGELLEALLTALKEDRPVDKVNLGEELADDLWYDAIAVDELGLDLNQLLDTLILKLRKRYKDKFAAFDSDNRNVAAERKILEAGAASPA